VLNSLIANLSVGVNTVVLNFNMVPGSNYQLGLNSSSSSDIYRSNTASIYPYNVGSAVSITGSSAGSAFYYWFYNWKVTKNDCSSQRVPVTVSVNPVISSSITVPSTFVCVEDVVPVTVNPTGGTLSGNGVSGSNFNASNGVGNYYVKYVFTNPSGCISKDSLLLSAGICTGINLQNQPALSISVYPNPVKNNLSIKSHTGNLLLNISLCDVTGRIVFAKEMLNEEETINLSTLSNGMYLFNVKDSSGRLLLSSKLFKE
jgi:hypothetical protein